MNEIDKTYLQIENKILNHEVYQNVKNYSKSKKNKNIFRNWKPT